MTAHCAQKTFWICGTKVKSGQAMVNIGGRDYWIVTGTPSAGELNLTWLRRNAALVQQIMRAQPGDPIGPHLLGRTDIDPALLAKLADAEPSTHIPCTIAFDNGEVLTGMYFDPSRARRPGPGDFDPWSIRDPHTRDAYITQVLEHLPTQAGESRGLLSVAVNAALRDEHPNARRAAVVHLANDPDILLELATNDHNADVRVQAAAELRDRKSLLTYLGTTTPDTAMDRSARRDAISKLSDLDLADLARTSDTETAQTALGAMRSRVMLATLDGWAEAAGREDLREMISARIDDLAAHPETITSPADTAEAARTAAERIRQAAEHHTYGQPRSESEIRKRQARIAPTVLSSLDDDVLAALSGDRLIGARAAELLAQRRLHTDDVTTMIDLLNGEVAIARAIAAETVGTPINLDETLDDIIETLGCTDELLGALLETGDELDHQAVQALMRHHGEFPAARPNTKNITGEGLIRVRVFHSSDGAVGILTPSSDGTAWQPYITSADADAISAMFGDRPTTDQWPEGTYVVRRRGDGGWHADRTDGIPRPR